MWEEKSAKTWKANLYIVGDYPVILDCCREVTFPKGLCVTIEKCDYVYAGGMEGGFNIGFIQYPKYPEDEGSLLEKAVALGKKICERNYQWSFTIVTSKTTLYFSRRDFFNK